MAICEIITIGDELLIGQVIDTNSAWIAQRLNERGVGIKQITSVSDSAGHILKALAEAEGRADIILITGGLGPTKDDITKKTLCTFFGSQLIRHEPSLKVITEIFQSRAREVTPVNIQQADVPDNCLVLLNHLGTAPGMLFEREGKIFISMPGVPSEMKGMMNNDVLPLLTARFNLPPLVHKTILTQGIGESFLSDMISDWEDNLPPSIRLAYLPGAGMVRLRLSAFGDNEEQIRAAVELETEKLKSLISDYIFGYDDDKLEDIVGRLLLQSKKTLSTAESCTGGYIAHKITSVPGSSEYYIGSIVAYSNELKVNELDVDMHMLEKFGAVSEEVVKTMALSALKKFKTDYSIACSGIAGPGGGTPLKPVGNVWIAVAGHSQVITRKLQLGNFRERVIHETALHSLNTLRKLLISEQNSSFEI